jgi:hypothetical protein
MIELDEKIITLIFEINDHGVNAGTVHWPILAISEFKYWENPSLLEKEVLQFFCEDHPHLTPNKEYLKAWFVGELVKKTTS